MMPKALVMDVHSRAGLEVLQSLGRYGVEMHIASEHDDCLAFRSRYARRILTQPTAGSERLIAWLDEIKSEDYDLIVPATEISLLAIRKLHPTHPVRTAAVVAGDESIDIALDKERTRELAAQLGLRVPSSVLIAQCGEIPPCAEYPVVLKPIRSKLFIDEAVVTLAPRIARTEDERTEFLQRYLPYTAFQQQQYVRGGGFGVEMLFAHGELRWSFAHQRLHEYPLTGGGSSYRRSVALQSELLEPAARLMSALQWHGAAMVEFKWDRVSPPVLMEINPRLWGSLALAIDAGVDFPTGLLHVAMSKALSPQPAYRVGYYTRDLFTDLEWQKANLVADRRDPLLFTRSRAISALEMLRPFTGQESWDHFDWRDAGVTGAILRKVANRWGGLLLTQPVRKIRQRTELRNSLQQMSRLTAKRHAIERILFVCFGNICRSPFAQEVARSLMPNLQIESAGFHQKSGRVAPPNMLRAATSMGLNLEACRSRQITDDLVNRAQLILIMDSENLRAMKTRFPSALDKCLPLGCFLEQPVLEIEDPWGKSDEETTRIARKIHTAVERLQQWLTRTDQRNQ